MLLTVTGTAGALGFAGWALVDRLAARRGARRRVAGARPLGSSVLEPVVGGRRPSAAAARPSSG